MDDLGVPPWLRNPLYMQMLLLQYPPVWCLIRFDLLGDGPSVASIYLRTLRHSETEFTWGAASLSFEACSLDLLWILGYSVIDDIRTFSSQDWESCRKTSIMGGWQGCPKWKATAHPLCGLGSSIPGFSAATFPDHGTVAQTDWPQKMDANK